MRKELIAIISAAVELQHASYNKGHENQGASIDVLSEVRRLLSTQSLSRNKKAQELLTEIQAFDTLHNEAIKYAKHLSFPVRGLIKRETFALIR